MLNLDLVKELIAKGADINAKDVDGRPPLYYAIYRNGAEDIFKYLIEQKANVEVTFTVKKKLGNPDEKGIKKTLLQFAKEKGKNDLADLLLKAGAKE